ncbi:MULTISPECIES: hypothetical protein [Nocardioides]|uniref:Uncharacterized protein n=1 Tax=Nocardioides lianchengensis TaxID=1045774 RepID=A0A1G7B0U1_9ACTN|nr:hypothetical protein [Nocardioides lianchengensis]NYG13351.1 hypothetical protein [Nocardioides lianchengensis]SDE19866.1 hypothetical protein SAMN05421872_116129 [Nocardioides lianchengensis]
MSYTRRRRRALNPVVARRRKLVLQGVGLSALALVTAVLVVRALQAG